MTRMIVMVINPGLQITPQVLPPAAENQPYSVTLRVLFGELPIKIRIVSGLLPDGLTLVDNGDGTATISGTPTETGDFAIGVEYEDVREDPRMQAYVLQVADIPQPALPIVVSGTAPEADEGDFYTYTFTASGGNGGPYTWSVSSGSLPTGITLNASTGTISGTPTVPGTYSFTITAADGVNPPGNSAPQSVEVVAIPISYATWNPADKGTIVTLSNGNLTASHNGAANGLVRSTVALTGKQYWEVEYEAYDGTGQAAGIIDGAYSNNADIAPFNVEGVFVWVNGVLQFWVEGAGGSTLIVGGTFVVPSGPFKLMFARDEVAEKFWIGYNGIWADASATTGDPATGTAPTVTGAIVTSQNFAMAAFRSAVSASKILNADFGQGGFSWPVPTGFTGVLE